MAPLNKESHQFTVNNNQQHDHNLPGSGTAHYFSNGGGISDLADGRSGTGKTPSALETSSPIGLSNRETSERIPHDCRMDQDFTRSYSSTESDDLDDSVGVTGNGDKAIDLPSHPKDGNNSSSTVNRPHSSTYINGRNGNAPTPSWPRSNRIWTWFSHLWKKTAGRSATMVETSRTTRTNGKVCFLRWNETTSSGWHMTKLWVFGMLTPIGIVTWMCTHQASAVLLSILVLPGVAIFQGSLAILKYRVQFGDSPLPKAPSHGIVKCVSRRKTDFFCRETRHHPLPTTAKYRYGSATVTKSNGGSLESITTSVLGESSTSFQGFVDPEHQHHPTSVASPSSSSSATPLRLLVIGDSLAIGVGQSSSATPIMPETIAKTLSKAMDGRPVLWSCHGAPGASAGWIVRELERSFQQGQFLQANPPHGRAYPGASSRNVDARTNFSDCDSLSSSDDSSTSLSTEEASPVEIQSKTDDHQEELKTWSERLKEHRIRFDPDVLGPFDIAVVLTGSNDLKSAFFPFLLTGEDAEFRRQAQQRGGSYGNELTRILQVLNRRMRMRLQTLRQSVEAATERVMVSVDNIRERLNSHDMHGAFGQNTVQRRTAESARDERIDVSVPVGSDEEDKETTKLLKENELMRESTHTRTSLHDSSRFPMVVLPGMPARALPIFQTAPLRWLAVPIVDIMDSHKKKLARHHDGEVMFIDAPSCEAITDYSCHRGLYWEEELDDRLLLNLRGIKRKQARAIESDMEAYFSKRQQSPEPDSLPFRRRHHSMFSVDGIHPNDQGYDFWGRYIGHAIVREWKQSQMREDNSSDYV
ncbi:hypothetical protein IV203_035353 [Nitzschia inconspicua]|uniref:SGNH hydrolase-type esterase domain-containing protein n=1 Tax=Nitzschia inconspicua TaxID=303405 RepID=A0A9K3PX30_9STRA|nr:hypothetical protein IV203_035353 [Nitzschia inconspicua]